MKIVFERYLEKHLKKGTMKIVFERYLEKHLKIGKDED